MTGKKCKGKGCGEINEVQIYTNEWETILEKYEKKLKEKSSLVN
jgi:hypothetical protein